MSGGGGNFTLAAGLKALWFAYAAFCPESRLSNWSCEWCTPNASTGAIVVQSALTGTYGYATVANDTIVVSFRGSNNVQNWIVDINAEQFVPWPQSMPDVHVHRGFYDGYDALRPQVHAAVDAIVAACPTCTEILCTGHSLGAALSGFCAFDLVARYSNLSVSMMNFGMPRIGDAAFAAAFAARPIRSFRCVHFHDIVPHLPLRVLWPLGDYHHVATEVWWFAETGAKSFRVCKGGEDPKCSDSVPFYEWSNPDHLVYLDVHNDNCGKDFR
jgi:predicted lipase